MAMVDDIILFGVIVSVGCENLISKDFSLRNGSDLFKWWAQPPIKPKIKIYIYNITNADEILNDGAKPMADELGPYVYTEKWEMINIQFNDDGTVCDNDNGTVYDNDNGTVCDNNNGTVSYSLKKIYYFDGSQSNGPENDVVVVPNIPMLTKGILISIKTRIQVNVAVTLITRVVNFVNFSEIRAIFPVMWYEEGY